MSTRKPPSKRKRGRPHKSESPMTPEAIEQIGELWLRGTNTTKLAKTYGVDRGTIVHHLERTIKPAWRQSMQGDLAECLAQVDAVRKEAWGQYQKATAPRKSPNAERVNPATYLSLVLACEEYRAKAGGFFAAVKHHIESTGELRVAGPGGPEAVTAEFMQRLAAKMDEMKAYRAHEAAHEASRQREAAFESRHGDDEHGDPNQPCRTYRQ